MRASYFFQQIATILWTIWKHKTDVISQGINPNPIFFMELIEKGQEYAFTFEPGNSKHFSTHYKGCN